MGRGDVDLRNDARTSTTPSTSPTPTYDTGSRRLPETKTFLASSEFWVMVGAVVALFVGGYVLDDIADANAWKYATWVAIAYIVSRGIAKAGSSRSYEPTYERRPLEDRAS